MDEWQRIFGQRVWDKRPGLLADDATFHAPSDLVPLRGKDAVIRSLRQSFDAFESVAYARRFNGDEGQDRTHDGRAFRTVNIIDEYTKEALVIRVGCKLISVDVVDALTDLPILRARRSTLARTTVPSSWLRRCEA